MGQTLFQNWTDNQLQAAFTLVNAEISNRNKRKQDEEFWNDVAYIMMLTGGME